MPSVSVNPVLLEWAITRSGLPPEQLHERFPKLDAWVSGEKSPTFRQLEDFARATMTPFGLMFLDAPPIEEFQIPDFRTRDDKPIGTFSPNLIDTLQTMQRRQAWMREWLLEQGAEPLEIVGSLSTQRNVQSAAQRIRQDLDLDVNWAGGLRSWEIALQTLRGAAERTGVIVFSNSVVGMNNSRPLDPEEFRGFVLCDDYAPVVFLNDADTKSARIFTLVHELAHVWIGQDAVFNLDSLLPAKEASERFCNRVAAEFLVPTDQMKSVWDEVKRSNQRFGLLGKQFKVSPLVVARRALDLRFISRLEFFEFYNEDQRRWQKIRSERRKDKSTSGNFYNTEGARLGHRFASALVRATREGRATYQEAYRLTGMKSQTFRRFSEKVRERMIANRE
ncbi:MAG: ImmA/IrrE family metallo-endopeptidase [Planctomycetota bacterium]